MVQKDVLYTEKERTYRPKLEYLALKLYKARKIQREAEEDFAPPIKDIMDLADITRYRGKKAAVNWITAIKQNANLKKLLKHVTLQTLYKNNLLEIVSVEKLESFLKKDGKKLEPKEYLKRGKPYDMLDINLIKKKK